MRTGMRCAKIYTAILSGLLLCISPISSATSSVNFTPKPYSLIEHNAERTLQNNLQQETFKSVTPPPKTTTSSFLKSIRSAVAARWQSSQLHTLVNALIQQPEIKIEYAEPGNSIKPFIAQTLSYDNNLLRRADTASNGLAERSKSDFIKQIRAGIAAKWTINRQVLLVNAIISQNWYSTYHELDYLGRDVLAQWNWKVGKNVAGEMGYINKSSRGNFSQLNNLVNNLQTENTYFANAAYQFSPGWFIRGSTSRQNLQYSSDNLLQTNNLRETTNEIGLKYVSPNNTMLGISATRTNGRFPQRILTENTDNAYTRTDFNLQGEWNYSIKTRLDGKLGYTQQKFAHLPQRNFSAPTARANLNWEITGKTALLLSAWREVGFVNNLDANFVLNQGVKIKPTWRATPKLDISTPLSYEQQDYLGDPGFISTSGNAGRDKITTVGLNADYTLFENTKMSLFMQFENRTSTALARNYQSKMVGLDMQVGF